MPFHVDFKHGLHNLDQFIWAQVLDLVVTFLLMHIHRELCGASGRDVRRAEFRYRAAGNVF